MIITTTNKEGKVRKPYIACANRKDQGGSQHPEGKWQIWFYFKEVFIDGVKYYKYYQLRYSNEPARFKTRAEAIEFAHYYLGLPVD